MTVNNYLDKQVIKNVIGMIKGSEEPGRIFIYSLKVIVEKLGPPKNCRLY